MGDILIRLQGLEFFFTFNRIASPWLNFLFVEEKPTFFIRLLTQVFNWRQPSICISFFLFHSILKRFLFHEVFLTWESLSSFNQALIVIKTNLEPYRLMLKLKSFLPRKVEIAVDGICKRDRKSRGNNYKYRNWLARSSNSNHCNICS